MRIVAADEAALALGIGQGLGLADARARVPELAAIAHDPAADLALLELIADDCERYTPSVALDPVNGLILDITGCAHLWDGEEALAGNVMARFAKAGIKARYAIAQTPDRARAIARHGEPLPAAALELEEEPRNALRRAGLYTIADLASRSKRPLAARFGMKIVTKLARVLGEDDVRITPRHEAPAIFALRRFAEPIARTDYVIETIASLVREAGAILRERDQGGRCFTARLFRSDGNVRELAVETGAPTRDVALLLRLFGERIETLTDPLDPGFGYDAVRLDVPRTERLEPAQAATDGQAGQSQHAPALIDQLGVRLGQKRVRRFMAGNSHIPELAGFTAPVMVAASPFDWPESEGGEPPLRPLHLFDPPQPIEVMAEAPDGPPKSFRWRRDIHKVVLLEGPERIAPEWWCRKRGHEDAEGLTRDYFRVEDMVGRRFWLFRHGLYSDARHPDWYLHGVFA